jgi:hypothetical protein
MNKINIDDYAPIDVLKKMTPLAIYDVIDRHIKEQKNTQEEGWTISSRKTLSSNNLTEKKKWQIAVDCLHTYGYWYGGACQNLD